MVGGAVFAASDQPFYFAGGTHAGYTWHHGFWGILDAWRRPKPEWWLAKLVFSPVWFPAREVAFTPGQRSVCLPVENRYSFTDLSELVFTWQVGQTEGEVTVDVPPHSTGHIEIPIPSGTVPGEKARLTGRDAHGELVNVVTVQLGPKQEVPLPGPRAGAPNHQRVEEAVLIEGNDFSLVFNTATRDFNANDAKHQAPVVRFPVPHVTRYDFGDLAGQMGSERR